MADIYQCEARLGRNYIRVGDTVKVKFPGKTQFQSGWVIKKIEDIAGVPHATVSRQGKWRIVAVSQSCVKRVARTKDGQAVERGR